MSALRYLIAIGILIVAPCAALGCGSNEYEQCWRVDLGPLREAKDCKCLPKIGGDAGRLAEEVKPHIAQLAEEIQKTSEALQECFSDLNKCKDQILAAPLSIPVQIYMDGLYKQSHGRTQSFSPEFVSLAQPKRRWRRCGQARLHLFFIPLRGSDHFT